MKAPTRLASLMLLTALGFFLFPGLRITAHAQTVTFSYNCTGDACSFGSLNVAEQVGQEASGSGTIDTVTYNLTSLTITNGNLTFNSNPATRIQGGSPTDFGATYGPHAPGASFIITGTQGGAGSPLMTGYFLAGGSSDLRGYGLVTFGSPIYITNIDPTLLADLGLAGAKTCGSGGLYDYFDPLFPGGPNVSVSVSFTPSNQPCLCVDPPNATMVAWYPFDETGGGRSANLATQNTGVWGGNPNPTPNPNGEVGYALTFSGAQYVDTPSSIVTNFGTGVASPQSCTGDDSTCMGDFSIDVWMNVPAVPSGVATIVDKRSGSPPAIQGYSFALYNNFLLLQLADGLGSAGYSNYLSPALPSNEASGWHHVAVTVHRSSLITWYYDGAPWGTSNPTDRLGSLLNNSPLRIGTNTTAPPLGNGFVGSLDELQIFNRALSALEVKSIYTAMNAGNCKP